MVKKQKIDLKNVGLLILAGFAWSKLGLGTAVKDVGKKPLVFRREYPPISEVGHMGQAEWQAKYGGSQLDYEDWLRGQ